MLLGREGLSSFRKPKENHREQNVYGLPCEVPRSLEQFLVEAEGEPDIHPAPDDDGFQLLSGRVDVLRRRWKVERVFAWMGQFRRLVTRWETSIVSYAGFLHLALTMIALRQL